MKTFKKTLFLASLFSLLFFNSCQEEEIEIIQSEESESLVAESELTELIELASRMDGSEDNIIDMASCISVKLPVKVKVNGIELTINTKQDLRKIKMIFLESQDDDDSVEIIFPIIVITKDHTEVAVNSRDELKEIIAKCIGGNNNNNNNDDDDDIECIDFKYPIHFSIYKANFQVIDVVKIENDMQLHRFIKRVKHSSVLASINFPVTMVLADSTEVVVNNNIELQKTIKEAKDTCDEDDDNDFGDNDFTKERLDKLLKECPWIVREFRKNAANLNDIYREYIMIFKAENIVVVKTKNGEVKTGKWETRVTDNGALIKLKFDTLVNFALEWFVYDLGPGKIKLFKSEGHLIVLHKNCDVSTDVSTERVENYLKECLWRIVRLSVNGANNENDYIGTPLKFFPNNVVKIRVNGEFVQGTYKVTANNDKFILKIMLEGRPHLGLEWVISFLENGIIKLENENNKMMLKKHCLNSNPDTSRVDKLLIASTWQVAKYHNGLVNVQDPTAQFLKYTLNFLESGRIKITDPNNGMSSGSWLSFKNNALYLGLQFGDNAPFSELSDRWMIKKITPVRVELIDLNDNEGEKRMLVLEKKM